LARAKWLSQPRRARSGSLDGIYMQHNSRHFRPIGAFGVSIEQAQIGDEMFAVIIGLRSSAVGA
jgi:hypothetical protein